MALILAAAAVAAPVGVVCAPVGVVCAPVGVVCAPVGVVSVGSFISHFERRFFTGGPEMSLLKENSAFEYNY